MGHEVITYESGAERFGDYALWTIRHFFIAEAAELEVIERSADVVALREYFESWDWQGPGVIAGLDPSSFILGRHARWLLILQLLRRARDRIARFGDVIPLSYLDEHHINTKGTYYTVAPPTKRFVEDIERISKFLSDHEPSV